MVNHTLAILADCSQQTTMVVLPSQTVFGWCKCLEVTLLLLLAVDFLILAHDPREQLIAGLLATGVRGYSFSLLFLCSLCNW